MGVLPQAPGGWRARRRRFHPPPHHPRGRTCLRRLRRQRRRPRRTAQADGDRSMTAIGQNESASQDGAQPQRRLRLGMVGGGAGAFIGAVHRIAARLDDCYEVVAGALSSDPARALASGTAIRLDPARCYADYREMARLEAARPDGIDVVAIVTPNDLHAPVATAFLEA